RRARMTKSSAMNPLLMAGRYATKAVATSARDHFQEEAKQECTLTRQAHPADTAEAGVPDCRERPRHNVARPGAANRHPDAPLKLAGFQRHRSCPEGHPRRASFR